MKVGRRIVMRSWTGALVGVLALVAPARALPKGAIVDLTYPYDSSTIYWPTETGFVLEQEHDGLTPKGYYYRSNKFSAPEHGGTHLDAPAHFAKDGNTLDAVPVEQLVGPAVVVDVTRTCQADRDHRISIDDLTAWEKQHGEIPHQAIVLLRTGFGKYWPDRKQYLGTDLRGDPGVAALHFPGLGPEAAAWLIRERAIKAVGLDTASIDYGQSTQYETHVELMTHNVPAMENLANLDRLPPSGITVVALPMKIRGGSGGPLRAIAIVEEQ
jgi:kynurenine formamidase